VQGACGIVKYGIVLHGPDSSQYAVDYFGINVIRPFCCDSLSQLPADTEVDRRSTSVSASNNYVEYQPQICYERVSFTVFVLRPNFDRPTVRNYYDIEPVDSDSKINHIW
jgi:hypothetical protein